MTERKYATSYASPSLTQGPDEIRIPCAGQVHVYDQLIDGMAWAVPAAKKICDACPIRAKCWTANADEQWVQVLKGRRINTRKSEARPRSLNEAEERAVYLEAAVNKGKGLNEVAEALKIRPDSVRRWCRAHGRNDLYNALAAIESEVAA